MERARGAMHCFCIKCEAANMSTTDTLSDDDVAEFLDLARSANIEFDIVHDRLHMRMVNPKWDIWKPIRHLLDEIGQPRIEAFVRQRASVQGAVGRWTGMSAERLHLAAEAMR
jgi:hypothetical protein